MVPGNHTAGIAALAERWELPALIDRAGQIIDKPQAILVQGCCDGRPNTRAVNGQIRDQLMQLHYHQMEYVGPVNQLFTDPQTGQINHKDKNIALYSSSLPAYYLSSAGGRWSPALSAAINCFSDNGQQISSVIMVDHDDCRAGQANHRLSWSDAVQFTVHDLYTTGVRYQVAIYASHVQTHGSRLSQLKLITRYRPNEFEQAVESQRAYQAQLPWENDPSRMSERWIQPLPNSITAGEIYAQRQRRR